jgi:hypothetical protein
MIAGIHDSCYNLPMPKQPPKKKHPGRRGDPLSAYPLTPEQLVRGIFQIKPEDVKRIVASKPGKKGK